MSRVAFWLWLEIVVRVILVLLVLIFSNSLLLDQSAYFRGPKCRTSVFENQNIGLQQDDSLSYYAHPGRSYRDKTFSDWIGQEKKQNGFRNDLTSFHMTFHCRA